MPAFEVHGTRNSRSMWCYTGDEKITNLIDRHELWFSHEFLCHPLAGFTVDWDATSDKAIEYALSDEYVEPEYNHEDINPLCYAGMIVRHLDPQRVWVLTGDYNTRTNGYLGRWPD